jgi:hypothetical protein
MIIDCDSCEVRGPACGDCVVSVLLGTPPAAGGIDLDGAEQAAIAVLAGSGLVPPLRLVPGDPFTDSEQVRRRRTAGHEVGHDERRASG